MYIKPDFYRIDKVMNKVVGCLNIMIDKVFMSLLSLLYVVDYLSLYLFISLHQRKLRTSLLSMQ